MSRKAYLVAVAGWLLALAAGAKSSGQELPAPPFAGTGTVPLLIGLPRSVYEGRRAELVRRIQAEAPRNASGPVLAVLRGADEHGLGMRFRQSEDFAYLTGVDLPSATLVMDLRTGETVLYLPPTSPLEGVFDEARPGPGSGTAAAFGFTRVEPSSRLLGDLFLALGDPMTGPRGGQALVYVRDGAEPIERTAGETGLIDLLKRGAPGTSLRDVRPLLAAMRKLKTAQEHALLREAIRATGAGLNAAAGTIAAGVPEWRVRAEIEAGFLREGAEGAAFRSIVAAGPNGTIPHYFGLSGTVAPADLVVVDIGASWRMYAADITRTFPASGRFSPRQRELYQLVLETQQAVANAMKPGGRSVIEMTGFAREHMNRSPLRARDESGREHPMGHFFVHGLGHHLGLEVHDVGRYDEPVQVGEVFTIEPGLYIKSEGIGIRIEDDYVMTERGPEKVSAALPSEPDAVERWMAEARSRASEKPAAEPGGAGR